MGSRAAAPLTTFQRLGAEGARMLVRITGAVDLTTVAALTDAIELARFAAVKVPELVEIEVDLRAVEFLSVTGMTELVRAHHRCGRDGVRLRVVADNRVVTRPLRLTGLDRLLGLRADPDPHPPSSAGEQLDRVGESGQAVALPG